MPAPLNLMVCGDEQNDTGESVWVHVKVTVTLLLFQPEPFGNGESDAPMGGPLIVNTTPLLATPLTLTRTGPVVAGAGTVAVIDVALHDAMAAATPLKVTAPDACAAPKFAPAIVTSWPAGPPAGVIAVMAGASARAKATALLARPSAVTTTGPDVPDVCEGAPGGTIATIDASVQLSMTAAMPLNVTIEEGCAGPKFDPGIVINWPTTPEDGDRDAIAGGTLRGSTGVAISATTSAAASARR